MKALKLLYNYLDVAITMDDPTEDIDEAIKELEAFIAKYQEASRRLDSTVITLAILQNENKSLLKAFDVDKT